MWEYTSTDELYHHGVLGMRWGHRKAKYSSGSRRSKRLVSNQRTSKDSRRAQYIKSKSVSQMSNKELKDVNNRLQLEKQYKDLTKKKSIGKKVLTTFIATAGTITATKAAYKTYETVGKEAVKAIGKYALHK